MDDLIKILDSISSPDATTRTTAESQLQSMLSLEPSPTLVSLIYIATSPEGSSPRRIQALIIFRRVALQPPSMLDLSSASVDERDDRDQRPTHPALLPKRWETTDLASRETIERTLLNALAKSEVKLDAERNAICDVVAEIYKIRGPEPWTEFSRLLSQLFSSPSPSLREACFRLYSECIELLLDESPRTAIQGLSTGLNDQSVKTRLAALQASCRLFASVEPIHQVDKYSELVKKVLQTLPPLAESASEDDQPLTTALLELIELASTPKLSPRIFKSHLQTLLQFSLSLIQSSNEYDETIRSSALELLVSLTETCSTQIRSSNNFIPSLTNTILQLMTEKSDDDPSELTKWLEKEVIKDVEEDDELATIAEQALDRIAQRIGNNVFENVVKDLERMLSREKEWNVKSAGLSAIAAVAEGCQNEMVTKLGYFIRAITSLSNDPHPRVKYAVIYALGQMCTDLEDQVQAEFGQDVLRVFVSNMMGQERRLQAFAAAACVNFFRSTEVDEPLRPFLPDVVNALLHLLQTGTAFVQGNALEALTIVAAYMEERFAPFYSKIMPLLLNILEAGVTPAFEKLRAQALDCASNIAAAVDPSLFAPDAPRLLTAMQAISTSLPEDDEVTRPYLLTAFCHLAATVGPEAFAPYINETFPQLLKRASKEPEISIGESDEMIAEDDDQPQDWETLSIDGQTVSIRTSAVDDKLEAVQNLISLVSTLSSTLPLPALQQVVQTALPLLKFVWYITIRESAAALIAVTVQALSAHDLTNEEKTFVCSTCSDALAPHIATDTDPEFLATALSSIATVYSCFPRGILAISSRDLCIRAIEGKLVDLARRADERASNLSGDADGEDEEAEEEELGDLEVWYGINVVIKELLKQHLEMDPSSSTTSFPIAAFSAPLNAFSASTTRNGAKRFAVRLMCDILDQLGEKGLPIVQPRLDQVVRCLHDQDATVRRSSAYLVGLSIDRSPNSLGAWASSLVEPLFSAINAVDPATSEGDDDALAARDNAISALSKIIRASPPSPAVDAVLSRWISALPILVDEEEFRPVYSLLIELMKRNHPSIASSQTHLLKVLVQTLQQPALPLDIEGSLVVELKKLISALPEGSEARQIAQILPQDVLSKLV